MLLAMGVLGGRSLAAVRNHPPSTVFSEQPDGTSPLILEAPGFSKLLPAVMQWGMLHNPMEVPQKYNPPPVPLCSQLSDPWQTLWIALTSAKGEEVKVLSLKFKRTERQTLAFILEMRSWITHPLSF